MYYSNDRHLACRLGTTGRFGVRELTVAATRYRIALRGRLSERFGYVFNGMTLEYGPNQTVLVDDVPGSKRICTGCSTRCGTSGSNCS